MTSVYVPLGVESVVENNLSMTVYDFLKMDMKEATILETKLIDDILKMDLHLLSMNEFMEWSDLLDGWNNNLRKVGGAFHLVQMCIGKHRINRLSDCEDEMDIGCDGDYNKTDEIDG